MYPEKYKRPQNNIDMGCMGFWPPVAKS
uniref:Uncharacterized protein n=1 Tax=Arundo donax TaxID=35708 RepID=A0A0A9A1U9_ARUDO